MADHDNTETGANKLKGMLPAKTVVGHKTIFRPNADGMKTADNDSASLSFPTAGNTTLPPSSWTHTRRRGQCEHHRPHITHGI